MSDYAYCQADYTPRLDILANDIGIAMHERDMLVEKLKTCPSSGRNLRAQIKRLNRSIARLTEEARKHPYD